jgi:hypothetical protein
MVSIGVRRVARRPLWRIASGAIAINKVCRRRLGRRIARGGMASKGIAVRRVARRPLWRIDSGSIPISQVCLQRLGLRIARGGMASGTTSRECRDSHCRSNCRQVAIYSFALALQHGTPNDLQASVTLWQLGQISGNHVCRRKVRDVR